MRHLLTSVQISDYRERYETPFMWVVKIIAGGTCLWLIASHIDLRKVSFSSFNMLWDNARLASIVLLLMPINWLLESWRWKLAMRNEEVSFLEAIQRVLRGLALNWILPLSLGDAGSRLAGVSDYKRSAKALVANRIIMLVITLVFGSIASLYYFQVLSILNSVLIIALLAGLVFLALGIASSHSFSGKIVLISLIRYIVFTLQFSLLIFIFLPQINAEIIFFGVGWIFFFRTLIPSFFGNFGVREASALVFFEPYVVDMSLILIPCLLIWVINTILPSLVGVLMFFGFKTSLA